MEVYELRKRINYMISWSFSVGWRAAGNKARRNQPLHDLPSVPRAPVCAGGVSLYVVDFN